jgi:hypothetical protein
MNHMGVSFYQFRFPTYLKNPLCISPIFIIFVLEIKQGCQYDRNSYYGKDY